MIFLLNWFPPRRKAELMTIIATEATLTQSASGNLRRTNTDHLILRNDDYVCMCTEVLLRIMAVLAYKRDNANCESL